VRALGDPLDEQGYVHLPQAPGMGYQLEWEYINENRI
jgi:L-alanine-DL-glutamate epimerase-like enolase superfamily enzyme